MANMTRVFLVLALLGLPALAFAQPARTVITSGTNTTSTAAESLATSQTVDEVLVQNDPDNTVDILVGSASSQDIQLSPGQAITLVTDNIATIYIRSVSGTPVVAYIASYIFRP